MHNTGTIPLPLTQLMCHPPLVHGLPNGALHWSEQDLVPPPGQQCIISDAWTQIDTGSSDMTAVQVHMELGMILIINTYNDTTQQEGVKKAVWMIRDSTHRGQPMSHARDLIWLGDFNLHHPM